MASHHMTASVVASTQPQTHVGLQGVQHNYSHYPSHPCTVVGGVGQHQENNNYYEHQLSAAMHTGSYGVGVPISGSGPDMGQQPQQPQAAASNHGGAGGSSPTSGGQRTSPVTSSIAQSAHGMSNFDNYLACSPDPTSTNSETANPEFSHFFLPN